MGRRHSGDVPAMRRHASGHARVRINGKAHWLGRWGSPEAQLKYDSLIAAYLASGRKSVEAVAAREPEPAAAPPAPAEITVGELCLLWLKHIQQSRGDDYKASSTYVAALAATRALRQVATVPASQFGPRRLLEVREAFAATRTIRRNKKGEIVVDKPRTRRYVNDVTGRIVQLFSWAVARELVPGDKAHALREVKPLRPGELATLVDTAPRSAVDDDRVEAVLAHLRPPLRALLRFCRLTGCRPGEAARLRMADIHDRECEVWRYVPQRHKNAWRGHGRHIPIGPQAQAIVLEAVGGRGETSYVFDPRLAVPDREPRKGTIKMRPRRASPRVSEFYTTAAIRHGVMRACEKAGCTGWFPYMLRYARNQEIRRKHGAEAAAVNLGDRSPQMLNRYAPPGWEKAVEAAMATG